MERLFSLLPRRSAAALLVGACGVLSTGTLSAQSITNLAAAGNGGHLVFFSSEFDKPDWAADHLIDGSSQSSWSGKSGGPQSIILAFAADGLVELQDLVINPYSRENNANWVKDVEIYVSTTYPFRDYELAGTIELKPEGTQQVFSFSAPTRARYLKLRFLSNHGGIYMQAGEVQAMGRALTGTPPAPGYGELGARSHVESFTSEFNNTDWAAANLLAADGVPGQWCGRTGETQEVVITLPEAIEITDIAVDNYARERPDNWAKDVEFQVSTTAAYRDFVSLGSLTLPALGDLHTLTLPAPTSARYVKVIFRNNHGGIYMQASRVRIYQVQSAGESLAEQLEATGRAVTQEIHFAFDSSEILLESTPILREIAAILEQQPGLQLTIEGHTDNVGSTEHNLELSRQRAAAVKRWLVAESGIGEARLSTVGQGMAHPIADNTTEEGRARNRRVELVRR